MPQTPEQRREKKAAYQRAYRAANPEKVRAQQAAHYAVNARAILEKHAAYRAANREKAREADRRYYEANREARAAYARAYNKANPELGRARYQRRRARLREAPGRGVTAADIQAMREAQGNHCWFEWCENEQVLHIAHIIALANGGPHDPDNVLLLCATHNLQQGTQDFWDYFDQVDRRARGVT
jgi:hypothetical protein